MRHARGSGHSVCRVGNRRFAMRERSMRPATSTSRRARNHPAGSPAHLRERNVSAIADIEREALHERSAADRLSDAITRVTGSVPFALLHLVWFVGWFLINAGMVPSVKPFDPFPFGFLTLVVSLEAIFLSVFVLMSQNRMTRQADKRAHLDLQIDLMAEQELTTILHMLRALCAKQGVRVHIPNARMREQLKETDVHSLAASLDERLPDQ